MIQNNQSYLTNQSFTLLGGVIIIPTPPYPVLGGVIMVLVFALGLFTLVRQRSVVVLGVEVKPEPGV